MKKLTTQMLVAARENAIRIATRNADDYIRLNPTDADRRRRDLEIELLGINNLYYRMIDEIKRNAG